MPRLETLREVFASLGLSEPPDWIPRLETALEPIKRVPQKRHDTLPPTPQKNHVPLAIWWVKWFGIESPPEWMEGVPEWNVQYIIREIEQDEEDEPKPAPKTGTTGRGPKLPKLENEDRNILLRTAEQWPANKKIIFVKGNKNSLQKKRARLNRKGRMVITKIVVSRIFDEDLHKKRVAFGISKKYFVKTLDGEIKIAVGEIRYEKINTNKIKFVYHYDYISDEKKLIGYEVCKGHDIYLSIAEQKEKVNGLEVTKGCIKPRWMSAEDWKKRQAVPFFKYLNTNWTASYGVQNPDLIAKFSGLDSEPDHKKAKSGSK